MTRSGASALRWTAIAGIVIFAAGCGMSEVQTDSTAGTRPAATPTGQQSGLPPGQQPVTIADTDVSAKPLLTRRNASIRTSNGTYVVQDVSFETGEGFGGSQAMMGHYNGTIWNFELRYVARLEVVGKIDAAEARTAPDQYFVRDDSNLRKTFRTRITKTDGETAEFVVRINAIHGDLETGGPLQISSDELETLKSIDFF